MANKIFNIIGILAIAISMFLCVILYMSESEQVAPRQVIEDPAQTQAEAPSQAELDARVEMRARRMALVCDRMLRPLWDRFRDFEDDPAFASAGFAQDPYKAWKAGVMRMQDRIYNKSLPGPERIAKAPCGREDVRTADGAGQFGVETSPTTSDLLRVAQGVFRKTDVAQQMALESRQRVNRILNYADFLKRED